MKFEEYIKQLKAEMTLWERIQYGFWRTFWGVVGFPEMTVLRIKMRLAALAHSILEKWDYPYGLKPCYKCGGLDLINDVEVTHYDEKTHKEELRSFVECLNCTDAFVGVSGVKSGDYQSGINAWNALPRD